MEETGEAPPTAPRKIRLTRAEAYAMRISSPRKTRLKFGAAGLLVAVALGVLLWRFQAWWLPYWLPEKEPAGASVPAAEVPVPAAATPASPEESAPSVPLGTPLNFLSAAVWDHPQFQQGVRLFNQALDQQRTFLRNRTPLALLVEAEKGAGQASQVFESLRTEAPASVPLNEYIARCRQLVAGVRRLARSNPSTQPAAAPAVRDLKPDELNRLPEYAACARAFNEALEHYNLYAANPSRKELLKPTEDLARQAAQQFEALKRQVPESLHRELDRQIHQCYGIVSACRGEQLKVESPATGSPFSRGTTGPARRPALPAYEPTPAP